MATWHVSTSEFENDDRLHEYLWWHNGRIPDDVTTDLKEVAGVENIVITRGQGPLGLILFIKADSRFGSHKMNATWAAWETYFNAKVHGQPDGWQPTKPQVLDIQRATAVDVKHDEAVNWEAFVPESDTKAEPTWWHADVIPDQIVKHLQRAQVHTLVISRREGQGVVSILFGSKYGRRTDLADLLANDLLEMGRWRAVDTIVTSASGNWRSNTSGFDPNDYKAGQLMVAEASEAEAKRARTQ